VLGQRRPSSLIASAAWRECLYAAFRARYGRSAGSSSKPGFRIGAADQAHCAGAVGTVRLLVEVDLLSFLQVIELFRPAKRLGIEEQFLGLAVGAYPAPPGAKGGDDLRNASCTHRRGPFGLKRLYLCALRVAIRRHLRHGTLSPHPRVRNGHVYIVV